MVDKEKELTCEKCVFQYQCPILTKIRRAINSLKPVLEETTIRLEASIERVLGRYCHFFTEEKETNEEGF